MQLFYREKGIDTHPPLIILHGSCLLLQRSGTIRRGNHAYGTGNQT